MSHRYNIEYITFDQLMANVEDDLSSYSDVGHIESDKLIRVVQKCNSFLSVKINQVKTAVLNVKKGKVVLPSDFKLWSTGFICHKYEERLTTNSAGFKMHMESSDCKTCVVCGECEKTCDHVVVLENTTLAVEVKEQVPLVLSQPEYTCETCDEPIFDGAYRVAIERHEDDLYLLCGFDEAKIIIRYISKMESPEDILIYDHPLVREYYEYAVKERILEELWLNGKEEVLRKYQLVTEKHRQAKIEAKRFVNTPDFSEIKGYHTSKRRKMYNKFWGPLTRKLPRSYSVNRGVGLIPPFEEDPSYAHWYQYHIDGPAEV